MIDVPYVLVGKQIPRHAVPEGREVHPAPCIFCGAPIEHVDDGGIGRLLGARVDGESWVYLYCNSGPCAQRSAPWIWRCGCVPDYAENVRGHCYQCRKPRHEAEPYDRVECPVCGEAHRLDDRLGIGNGRCRSCTAGPAYLPVLHETPEWTPLRALRGGVHGE